MKVEQLHLGSVRCEIFVSLVLNMKNESSLKPLFIYLGNGGNWRIVDVFDLKKNDELIVCMYIYTLTYVYELKYCNFKDMYVGLGIDIRIKEIEGRQVHYV